ncbi:hypothetical protein HYR99_14720 [Candidatus Poribacteria bacterium]|nr:hypothetical protein [Candidatus Poribacteria bacterium]
MHRSTEPLSTRREPFAVRSENNLKIAGFVETALETPKTAPVVVSVPTYGKTMRDHFAISWYLLRHGFRVVRYDNTCHIGASEGDVFDFTLRSAIADVLAVTRYVTETVRPPSLGVVAPSLAFRVAIRAFRNFGDLSLLFALVGVVNLRFTLTQVTGIDFFQEYEEGRLPPSYTVLGHKVGSPFLVTAVQDDLASLKSTRADLRRCPFPIVYIAAEKDLWVNLKEVQQAFFKAGDEHERCLFYLPAVHHHLSKNPVAAALAMEQMVVSCSQYVGLRPIRAEEVIHPSLVEMVRVNKFERSLEKEGYLL